MITLDEAGIESIGLVIDGQAYETADGDVTVHGESEVVYTDGSTGTAADAEFAYEEEAFLADDLEVITDSGDVVNLDETSGLDEAPADQNQNAFDSAEEHSGGGASLSPEDDAAQAAAETGLI